uniref:Ig-like domain-containing protein n=1 Tax=Aeromonas veronii TaxID=654 RepID=UPI003D1E24FB
LASKDGITSNSVGVEVTDAVITSIEVSPTSLRVARGQSEALKATAIYSDQTQSDISDYAAWITEDAMTANVTRAGRAVGIEVGATRITASKDGVSSDAVTVEVTDAVLTELSVVPDPITISKGQIDKLKAIASYSDGSMTDATDEVSWVVIDSNVASVDTNGVITGLNMGETQLLVSKTGVESNLISVTVRNSVPVKFIGDFSIPDNTLRSWSDADQFCRSLDGGNWRLPYQHELVALKYEYELDYETNLEWADTTYWTSTKSDLYDGYAAIYLEYGTASGLSGSCGAHICAPPANANTTCIKSPVTPGSYILKIDVSPITLGKGQKKPLLAIATYSDGNTLNITADPASDWKLLNPTLGMITDAYGFYQLYIEAMEVGNTIVTVSNGGVVANARVDVYPWVTVANLGVFSVPDGVAKNWYEASDYCSTLSFGDGAIWRLPSLREIIDLRAVYGGAILGWPTIKVERLVWSADQNEKGEFFYVYLYDGRISSGLPTISFKQKVQATCVKVE